MVCVDTTSSLTKLFLFLSKLGCCHRGLEKLNTMYGYFCQIDNDQGSYFGDHDEQYWEKAHNVEWRFHFPYDPQAAGLVERKNGIILKQQIKLLTGKTTLLRKTEVMPQALTHLNDQQAGFIVPHARLGTLPKYPVL